MKNLRGRIIDEICHKRSVIRSFEVDEELVVSRGRLDESYELGYAAGLRVALEIIEKQKEVICSDG